MKLTPLIVSSAQLLRAIAQGGWTGVTPLAEAAGRHRNNLNADLKSLEKAGLIRSTGDKSWEVALTAAAEDGLAALDRAESDVAAAVPGDLVELTHDQIEPDPNNARRHIDQFDLNKLRLTIVEHGVLQNLVVRPAGANGKHQLVAGERRWRALDLAIQFEELPVGYPIPCRVLEPATEGDFEVAALIENLSREDLHPLDEARALDRLVNDHGLGTDGAAERVGRSRRHVQDRLRLLGMDDGLKSRMRLPEDDPNHLSATAARRLLNVPKPVPPVELTPKLGLALAELMAKSIAEPADLPEPGYTRIRDESGGPLSTLLERKFVNFRLEGHGPVGSRRAYAKVMRLSSDAGRWLEEQGWHDADHGDLLIRLADAAGIEARDGVWATTALNVVEPTSASNIAPAFAPEFSQAVRLDTLATAREADPNGTRGATCARVSGTTTCEGEAWPAEPVEVLKTLWSGHPSAEIELMRSSWDRWAVSVSTQFGPPNYSGAGSPPYVYTNDPLFASRAEAIDMAAATIRKRAAGHDNHAVPRKLETWLQEQGAAPPNDPLVVNGVRYPNATRAAEARRLAEGERVHVGSAGARPKPESEPSDEPTRDDTPLSAYGRLALAELAHAAGVQLGTDLQIDSPLPSVPTHEYWRDGALMPLITAGYVEIAPGPGGHAARLTDKGGARLVQDLEKSPCLIDRLDLAHLREVAGATPTGGYTTMFLNGPPAASGDKKAEPEPGAGLGLGAAIAATVTDAHPRDWKTDVELLAVTLEQALDQLRSAREEIRDRMPKEGGDTWALDDIDAFIGRAEAQLWAAGFDPDEGGDQGVATEIERAGIDKRDPAPAVPVRKSITPDHIVCLEDGRKFKSLKRHLRTRYDLSPEQYREKWGLPKDYPMVAPNYAKARHDLALRMGVAR